jgi:predicted lysophospholipase L1 biosynthesis ABC-type transport system permease subunit
MTVVGVVEDVQTLDDQGTTFATSGIRLPILFAPYAQMPTPPVGWRPFGCCDGVMVGVRPGGPSRPAAEALRHAFLLTTPNLPVEVARMSELHVSGGYGGSSMSRTGRLLAAGTIVALLLAALGIIGVVREAVGRRTREFGLRIALGARARQVVGSAAWETAGAAALGVALGLVGLLTLGRSLSGVVFDYFVQRLTDSVLNPVVLLVATAVVILSAAATAAASAASAARVDPMVALRSE